MEKIFDLCQGKIFYGVIILNLMYHPAYYIGTEIFDERMSHET